MLDKNSEMSINYPTASWANGSNIYEVNIRQYTVEGTFKAFAEHLPRLKNMGVEILWLMPITPVSVEKRQGSLGSYYACSSYVEINPEFGTLDDFKSLINQVHQLEMKIIIDWVANHTGWDHHWTTEHPEWYKKNEHGNFYDSNGWTDVIDLDYSNKHMRKEMIRAMVYWIKECNIDGFRCDMAHLVPLDFWQQARKQCEHIKKLYWLGECEVDEYNKVFDATYGWEWMHTSEKFIKQTVGLGALISVLSKYGEIPQGSKKLLFTTNHDENSWNGTEYEKYGHAAKAFAVFSACWLGIPLIYSGQELPNLKRLSFFDKDVIGWKDGNISLSSFYSTLLSLRKKNKAFHPKAKLAYLNVGFEDKIIAYLLSNEQDQVIALFNFSHTGRLKFSLSDERVIGEYKNIFSGIEHCFDTTIPFEMQPWEYIVYERITL